MALLVRGRAGADATEEISRLEAALIESAATEQPCGPEGAFAPGPAGAR